MVDQLIEAVAHEAIRHRLLEPRFAQLEQQTFAQVARADARRVERLNHAQHCLALGLGVEREILGVAAEVFGGLGDPFVDAATNLVERACEVAVLVDVADELLGELVLALIEIEELDLVAEVIAEIATVDGDGLEVFLLLVLLGATARVEAVEENLLPVDLVSGLFLRLLFFGLPFLGGALLAVFVFILLVHLEERVVEELLLEVLLEIEERHVEEIHRLVEAGIDLDLLLHLGVLRHARSHAAPPLLGRATPSAKRARSRAASVGPR